jgi:hypothetical protein
LWGGRRYGIGPSTLAKRRRGGCEWTYDMEMKMNELRLDFGDDILFLLKK